MHRSHMSPRQKNCPSEAPLEPFFSEAGPSRTGPASGPHSMRGSQLRENFPPSCAIQGYLAHKLQGWSWALRHRPTVGSYGMVDILLEWSLRSNEVR